MSYPCSWEYLIIVEKNKLFLANLITFCDDMTGNVDKGRTGDVIFLDFNKFFNGVSIKNLIWKLEKYKPDEWTVKWIESPQVCQVEKWK